MSMVKRIFLFLAVIFLLASPARAAQVYQAGFRTMGAFDDEAQLRVDMNIWYPTMRQAKDLNYPPWTVNGAWNARPADGHFPLLIISHASTTDRFSHHDLATFLAREGFVVAAITHPRDCMSNMDDLFTWKQLASRAREIDYTIDLLLADKDLAHVIDGNRVGVIGFGSGGTVGLLLGGALPNCDNWYNWCTSVGAADVYCSPWARDRMNSLCAKFPLRKSLANTRVKAMATIAPGFAMLFDRESFRYFYPPLLLVAAGKDQFNPARLHSEPLGHMLGEKARFLDLPSADAGALMAPCPSALNVELPELCQSVTREEKTKIQSTLREALAAFFSHYLVVIGNIPVIPEPPDLEPKPEPQPAAPVKKRQRR